MAEQKVCSTREFKRAHSAAYIKATLGTVPESAADLIDVIIENYRVGTASTANSSLAWTCPMTAERRPCDEMKLVQEAHRINDTILNNKLREATIGRAVRYWIDTHRETDQQQRFQSLCLPGTFDWVGFGDTFLEDSRVRRDIQVAVLQKFIWQVKRRMAGLPVSNHLMAVIYGVQGKGKSKAVEIITAPLGHLVSSGDFQRLGDIREVAMFQSFVVVLDEMQKASHADVDRVKNVVTRDHFSYRPMHSNSNVASIQNATFIGTSNRTLDQMIHDPTGNRRFFQIDWSSDTGPVQWDYLNGLCINDMWRSVDHLSDDPTAPFMHEIRAIQEQWAYRNSVGQFFDAVVEGRGTCTVRESSGVMTREFVGILRREDFFHAYRGYCEHMRIKSPLEPQAFYKEVRRIADQESGCPFEAAKSRQYNGWRYIGPKGSISNPLRIAAAAIRYMVTHTGPLASFSTDAMAYLKSGAPGHDGLDLKYYFLPLLSGDSAQIVRQHGFTNLVILTRPESRGELKLRSADPFDQPIIDANYLAEERDRDALRRGVRIAREIFKQPAYAKYRGEEYYPGAHCSKDADLDAFFRRDCQVNYEAVGTCRMGHDEKAVVDDQLRVHGVEGLRVVDGSVMPRITTGDPNASIIMIAEKAADMMLKD